VNVFLSFIFLGILSTLADACVLNGSPYQLASDTVRWSLKLSGGETCIRGVRFNNVAVDKLRVVSGPQTGHVTLLGSGFSYEAATDFQGSDSFSLMVSGATNKIPGSSTIEVEVSVTRASELRTAIPPSIAHPSPRSPTGSATSSPPPPPPPGQAAAPANAAVTHPFTITVSTGSVQGPGPSQALFSSPYYQCVTNYYVATNGSNSNDGKAPVTVSGHGPWLTLAHANFSLPTGGAAAGSCINVAPGTYAAGVSITAGGNAATAIGYVVYRCATLNGCTINDHGNNVGHSAFGFGANYAMVDGFVLNGGNGTSAYTVGVGSGCQSGACGYGGSDTVLGHHHLWVLNNIISGYGQGGIQLNQGEYIYAIHNKIYNNSHDCQTGAQGSNISIYLPIATPSYTPTADDQNNPVTGNTGDHFHQFIMWNALYNSYVCTSGTGDTDGNGIILDDWYGDQFGSCVSGISPAKGGCAYLGGGLVAFNVSYNNGGGGVHVFSGQFVTVANNDVFNNAIDSHTTGTFHANMDENGSYAINFVNNVSHQSCILTGALADTQSAMGVYGTGGKGYGLASTTLSAAITTTTATSVTVTSNAKFPGGGSSTTPWNGDYTLPGGNEIMIGGEIMQVTAGWGTNTWTVTRGFNGTTAATHSKGETVRWIQSYYTNNITQIDSGGCSEIDQENSPNNTYYSATANKKATSTGWIDVGNTSYGTDATPPVGANFALQGGSAAIGYGTIAAPFNFLPSTAVDAGACHHSLATCP
jgi:hypothetical protein